MILPRDTKANADEAVRLARELIIKDNVNFLVGTLTSTEAPAVSTVAKENKIVFLAPSAKTIGLTAPANLHPYIFRVASNTNIEGAAGAIIMAKWQGIKRVATIAPDYAYGHDDITAFIAKLKQLRPDIEIVDQEWPKLGEPDFTPFITAQMGKKPDAVYCALFAGDFISFVKQGAPLGYFKAIHNRLADGGEVGAVDETSALGADYPFGIWADAYDPVIWSGAEPPAHKAFIQHLRAFTKSKYGSGWSVMGYIPIEALAAAVKKAGSTNEQKVAADARPDHRYADRRADISCQDARDGNGRILGGDDQNGGLSVCRDQRSDLLRSGARKGIAAPAGAAQPSGLNGSLPRCRLPLHSISS